MLMNDDVRNIAKKYIELRKLISSIDGQVMMKEELEQELIKLIDGNEIKFRYKGLNITLNAKPTRKVYIDYEGLYEAVLRIDTELANELFTRETKVVTKGDKELIETAVHDEEISRDTLLKYSKIKKYDAKLKVKEFKDE